MVERIDKYLRTILEIKLTTNILSQYPLYSISIVESLEIVEVTCLNDASHALIFLLFSDLAQPKNQIYKD